MCLCVKSPKYLSPIKKKKKPLALPQQLRMNGHFEPNITQKLSNLHGSVGKKDSGKTLYVHP